jgi:hypothetical protein
MNGSQTCHRCNTPRLFLTALLAAWVIPMGTAALAEDLQGHVERSGVRLARPKLLALGGTTGSAVASAPSADIESMKNSVSDLEEAFQKVRRSPATKGESDRQKQLQAALDTAFPKEWNACQKQTESLEAFTRPELVLSAQMSPNLSSPTPNYGAIEQAYAPAGLTSAPYTGPVIRPSNCSCGTAMPTSACMGERTSSIYSGNYVVPSMTSLYSGAGSRSSGGSRGSGGHRR